MSSRCKAKTSLPLYPRHVDKFGLSERNTESESNEKEYQERIKRAKKLIAYVNKDLSYLPEMIYCKESEEEDEEGMRRSHRH
ncbi:hypothetical protein CHS0354_007280 [Potamilus streckersoni]|uniref:Uncharacterized protein n=1 Tax=Potamilus streckersoni TaxID=2493646 RepID=A0AAE0TE12_9BIVA|nr:hypothetical protein CHS0354_007280 [Potamilus streckersoni]